MVKSGTSKTLYIRFKEPFEQPTAYICLAFRIILSALRNDVNFRVYNDDVTLFERNSLETACSFYLQYKYSCEFVGCGAVC